MSRAERASQTERDDSLNDEEIESLRFVRDNYDGAISEAARQLLQSSDEVSNE